MIIKAYYAGGRIDVFDTDRMTDGIPQPGNLLTNYTLDLSDVGEECLWLRSYYYEAADAYKDEPGPTGLPMARRRDGWSFLIADEEDLKALNRLTVDGETVLAQVAGEIIDVGTLSWICDVADVFAPRILAVYKLQNYLESSEELFSPDAPNSLINISPDCINHILNIYCSEDKT